MSFRAGSLLMAWLYSNGLSGSLVYYQASPQVNAKRCSLFFSFLSIAMGCWHRDRIANQLFDDPPRVLPPEPEKAKVALEMDDKKSHKVSKSSENASPTRSSSSLWDLCLHVRAAIHEVSMPSLPCKQPAAKHSAKTQLIPWGFLPSPCN